MHLDEALSVFDTYVWEPLQRRFPVLTKLDNEDWKSWICHGALTLVFGALLSLIPHVSLLWGVRVVTALYVIREVSARRRLGWRYKPLDGIGDIVGPGVVLYIVTWLST